MPSIWGESLFKLLVKKPREISPHLARTEMATPSPDVMPDFPLQPMDESQPLDHGGKIGTTKAILQTRQPTNISISVPSVDEWVEGLLHLPTTDRSSPGEGFGPTAAILFAGVFGGFDGPSSIYQEVGHRLADCSPGMPILRLDYRYPAILPACIEDVQSSIAYLENKYAISNFVLVGWSFGGAVVYTTAALDREKIVGCSTIASQLDGTRGISSLSPIPVLLLHGTADQILGASCSEVLYQKYGPDGDRTIHLFKGDDHNLTKNRSEAVDLLCDFISRCARFDEKDKTLGKEVSDT